MFRNRFKLKFPLEDGMRVRLYGRPRIYSKTGKFSINVEWVEPAGEGALKRRLNAKRTGKRRVVCSRTQAENSKISEKNRTHRFQRIGGLWRFCESSAASFGGIEIYLYHTAVQEVKRFRNSRSV